VEGLIVRSFIALLAGLLFGLGLDLGGMTRPSVVLSFLDVAGAWNPQLLFVMAGAVATAAIGYRLVLRRPRPVLAERFRLPSTQGLGARLLGGAALFGIGWGLVGYCPGPALASLASASPATLWFVLAMVLGWWLGARFRVSRA
jgi:uncharacterized membrane protein YedE/YeeE